MLQKVPMPPNRDTVSASYLQDIAAEVLGTTYHLMSGDDSLKTGNAVRIARAGAVLQSRRQRSRFMQRRHAVAAGAIQHLSPGR